MADIPPKTAISAPVPADVRERDEDIAGEGDKAWHMPEMNRVVHNHVEKRMIERILDQIARQIIEGLFRYGN